ncbi:MAG: RNase adapter RapZ, partial [Clostridiales bacterium]|nr:RNase adapter RapZ [Clostridiales bacterium]
MQIVIVTGLSGAGKTQAVICLEDLGYYCIDNMPPTLVKDFIGLASRDQSGVQKAAFVMDVRVGEFFADIKSCLDDLKNAEIAYKLVFLEASDEALIRRFNETRRAHPLSSGFSTALGIQKERDALHEIRNMADFIIDTSNMKSMRLREEIKQIFTAEDGAHDFTINVGSFGFKNGIPLDADMVFDVRFIPNPYYVPGLKKLTGNNKKVRQYVMQFAESKDFIQKIE